MLVISILILLSFIPFIYVVPIRTYPYEKINTNSEEDDSLSGTSVPNIFNWTSKNQEHFIIFDRVPFEAKIVFGCIFDINNDNKILLSFIKPKNSENIFGYCISEIEDVEKKFLKAECKEKHITDVHCHFGYIEDYVCDKSKRKNPHFPKPETKNLASGDLQINYFWLLLIVIFGTLIANLGADVIRSGFYNYLQPRFRNFYNRYFPAPANEDGL